MPSIARSSFMGDDAEAVSRLVAACERPDFSNVPVVERTLQPYFSDPEEEQKAVQEVQRKLTCNSGRKNIRSGSPISSAPQPIKGSRPHKVAKAAALLAGSPPAGAAATTPAKTTAANANRAASPTSFKMPVDVPVYKTTPVHYIVKVAPASAPAAACPAIFKSPKPSDLPMPSSALLRRLAIVTGPAACMMMMPSVALPVMAAA